MLSRYQVDSHLDRSDKAVLALSLPIFASRQPTDMQPEALTEVSSNKSWNGHGQHDADCSRTCSEAPTANDDQAPVRCTTALALRDF